MKNKVVEYIEKALYEVIKLLRFYFIWFNYDNFLKISLWEVEGNCSCKNKNNSHMNIKLNFSQIIYSIYKNQFFFAGKYT